MARLKNTGTAVIYFNTSEEKCKPISYGALTPIQQQCFQALKLDIQLDILKGAPVSVLDMESGNTICDFNLENIYVSEWQIEALARSFYPEMLEFFENKDNVEAAKAWAAKHADKLKQPKKKRKRR